MPFTNVNGNDLYFEDSGGNRPAVIFSHGFLLDHSMWDTQVSELSSDYRCITWDQRGHGMSDCFGPFDFYDAASDAITILDQLRIAKAVFVGLSQGGFLSMRAAWKYPTRVTALVLIDTAAACFSEEVLAGYHATADSWLSQGPVGEIATGMATLLFGTKYDASVWLGKWQAKPPCEWAHPWQTVLGRDDFMNRLPEIKCPSFVIHGAEDQAFDVATAEGLRDALGDCKGLKIVTGAAHAPNVTHPKAVNAALKTFLGKHA
ncbi:MAG: alpha/beta fold hydrolase [Myxococcota bacterium]